MCFKREFQNVKVSIILKQMSQLAKEFTQSYATHTLDIRGVCKKFLRRIGP
jgi:hypothetical protein